MFKFNSETTEIEDFAFYASTFSRQIIFPDTQVHQHPSIPWKFIKYISKNPPSIIVHKKLLQSCKYFYFKKSQKFLSVLQDCQVPWRGCANDGCGVCEKVPLKLKDIKNGSFLMEKLMIVPFCMPNLVSATSTLVQKLSKSTINDLALFSQDLTFDEFLFLTPELKSFRFCNVSVKYDDGSQVLIETIIKSLPKLKVLIGKLSPSDIYASANTVNEIVNLEHVKNMDTFILYCIPSKFDAGTFLKFITENKNVKFTLQFETRLNPANYKWLLNEYTVAKQSNEELSKWRNPPCLIFPNRAFDFGIHQKTSKKFKLF